jgi:acetate kinase
MAEKEGWSLSETESVLNRQSGLLGLSGLSADMRELEEAAAAGHAGAALAIDVFCYRVTKYAGAYAAAMGGLDALLFGGGVGEHSSEVRRRICESLAWLGLRLDLDANARAAGTSRISAPDSAIAAWVIAVDEDEIMARDVFTTLTA